MMITTLEQIIEEYGEDISIYDDILERYYEKEDFSRSDWEYLKTKPIEKIEDEDESIWVVMRICEILEDDEDEYQANGFSSAVDFWNWKEG